MDNLNVKNINDEKIFSVIDPQGQGEVQDRIRPISISINQDVKTVSDETESKVTISVYWNDTWKEILNLTFNDSLRKEYGKLVEDLTAIQKDIDMKQYKDAETKTNDMLKYLANISNKYTQMSTKIDNIKSSANPFVTVTAKKDHFSVKVSERLLNFLLSKFEKVATLDYRKSNENFCINASRYNEDTIDLYYHSPALFETQGYMTVVKNFKTIGSYKATYDQFSKLASKLSFTPEKMGYKKDRFVGYTKTAEVVMQNIFFDTVDEAKEWQEMVDEKKKEEVATEETNQEETTEKPTVSELPNDVQKGNSPAREDGGLARPDEDFAGADELPENEPQQQQQMGQGMAASRRLNLLKKKAKEEIEPGNIYEKAKAILPKEDIDHHETDLYLRVSPKSTELVNSMKYRNSGLLTTFKSNIDGDMWYELPFCYPFVERNSNKKSSKKKRVQKKAEEKYYKFENVAKQAENRKNYNVVIGFDGKEEESDFAQEDVISALQEALIYFGEKWHELPSSLDNIDKLDFVKIREIEKGETVKEYTKEDILKMKEDFPKYSCNKKALYGDVQEADIVPAKTETKVYLQSEEKKTASNYKAKLADLLNEINDPSPLMTYISESDAETICEECEIPHEAEWYKGDIFRYIGDVPEGMVDVLIEYISEDDAEELWRHIQHDMGNDIDSSKKTQVKKQAEDDTIAIGDIVTVDADTLADKDEFAKYEVFAGEPAILMEVDKGNIDNVVIEKVEYPYERTTIEKEKIDIYDDVAGEEIILEDADGDEMVATLSAIPEIAASTEIKSVKKVARLSKKAGYVKIDIEDYLNLLSDRAKEIGRQIPMEDEFFNYIRDFGEDTDFGSPSYVVDNYCINGEFVERESFTADGDYSNKFKEYNGDWNEFCSNEAVFYNEEEACLNLGL